MKRILIILFLKQALIGMLIGTSAILGGNFLMANIAPELAPGYGYGLCSGGLLVYMFLKAAEARRVGKQLRANFVAQFEPADIHREPCKSPLGQD